MVKLVKAAAGVVEHTIQHNAHVTVMCFVEQGAKSCIPTEDRVHVIIVVGMVTMVGR
jgi:hypothetical protein